MSRKKKKQGGQPQLSPKKYIVTRARTLPLYKCLVNKNWKESGMASITVMRKHSNNHVTTGLYLVDLLALGVKDTHFRFNEPERDITDEIYGRWPDDALEEVDYTLAHNIIYGAIAFAEDFDIEPHKDFEITQHILEEDTDEIELIDIPFGIDGKPAFITAVEREEEDGWELYDYDSFTDDDWRNFLDESREVSDEELTYMTEALFRRWLDIHKPAEYDRMEKLNGNEFEITFDAFSVGHRGDEQEEKELFEIYCRMCELDSPGEIHQAEQNIYDLLKLYPNNPVLYNYLGVCAQLKGDSTAYDAIIHDTLQKFPDYLYGKTGWLNKLIDENRLDEVPSFLDNKWHLHEVCPERKLFHISELESFYGTLIRYFTKTSAFHNAHYCMEMILDEREIELDNYRRGLTNVFETAQYELNICKIRKAVEYLSSLEIDISKMPVFSEAIAQRIE